LFGTSGATAEDHGWVLSFFYDGARQAFALWIIDAGDFAAPPVAIVDAEVPPPR